MHCPRCGAEGVDAAGYCVSCRLHRGPGQPQPPAQAMPTQPQPPTQAMPVPPQMPPRPPQMPPAQQRPGAQPPPMPDLPGAQPPPMPHLPGAQLPPVPHAPGPQVPPVPHAPGPQVPPMGHYAAPPPARRNPLLIPGIIFGVVALLLVGAVVVYAATSGGDDPAKTAAPGGNPVAVATGTPEPSDPEPEPSDTAAAVPGASGSAGPSASSAPPCVAGVWLEQKHDEQVTVLNTGTFPFTGSGTYHRYSDTGRVVFDYGDGMRLTGFDGSTRFEYIFAGAISYQYKVANGVITYTQPRPSGTETFIRNGHTDYQGKLEARVPEPMKINCGSVAMSLTNRIVTIELKRTSPAP